VDEEGTSQFPFPEEETKEKKQARGKRERHGREKKCCRMKLKLCRNKRETESTIFWDIHPLSFWSS
jgi:hypothetical protein